MQRLFKTKNLDLAKYIWIIVLISLLFIYFLHIIFSPDLNKVDVISIATFNNYDVGAVIKHFNIVIISFVLLLLGGVYLYSGFYKKYNYIKELSKYLNPLSCVLIILLFYQYVENYSISHFYFYFGWIILFIFFFTLFKREFKINKECNFYLFIILAAISFSIATFSPNVNIFGPIILFVFIILIKIFQKTVCLKFYNFIPSLRPLFFIIYIPVIAVEICSILRHRGIDVNSVIPAYIILFILVFSAILLLAIRKNKRSFHIKNEFYFFIFPVMLVGIVLRAYYAPYLAHTTEMFEFANPANGIVNTLIFNQIPFVDYLTAHAMSDTVFGFIYTLFHGFNWTTDFEAYHFLYLIFFYLASYFLFLRCFGKNPVSIVLVLLFPYLYILLNKDFFLIIFQIFIIYNLFKSYTTKKLISLFIITILGCLWRFDIGLPMALISVITVVICLLQNRNKQTLKSVIFTSSGFIGLFLILALVFYLRSSETFIAHFKQSINFLTCNQAHAHEDYHSGNNRMDFYHYTLFPIIGAFIVFMIIIGRNFFFSKKNLFVSTSIMVFVLTYFFNFQRGVTRHSLFEGGDSFTSIFIYMAIGLFIYLLIRKNTYSRYLFLIIISFLCYNFKYRSVEGLTSLLYSYEKKQKLPELMSFNNISQPYLYDNLKKFMDENFEPDATFIDLSNSPMLYFHTQRKVPSYFCQNLQNTVTSYLQEETIKLYNNTSLPVAILTSRPPTWFDSTDGVANSLRYNLITKYIYENYKPFYIIDNYEIWLDKDLNLDKPSVPYTDITPLIFSHNLILYPYLLGSDKDYKNNDGPILSINNHERFDLSLPTPVKNKTLYISINIPPVNNTGEAFLYFYSKGEKIGHIQFRVKENCNSQQYIIPIDYIYDVYNNQIEAFGLSIYDIDFDENMKIGLNIYSR